MRTPSSRVQTTVLPPGEVPPGADSIAARTWQLIADHPYQYTSGDLIFTVYADRQGISGRSRPAARRSSTRSLMLACVRRISASATAGKFMRTRMGAWPSMASKRLSVLRLPLGKDVTGLASVCSKR